MAQIRDRPDAQMLQSMVLRSMQQAVYSPDNIGHFGLAYEAYAHFTSPIRRYPDLLTHRAIYAILQGKKYQPSIGHEISLSTGLTKAAREMQKSDDDSRGRSRNNVAIWEELGLHCSSNERRADEASRDVEAWLKCYFMRDKLGEEYGGMVNGVTSFGIFVQLDSLFIEGLVHVTELGSDYFQYDEIKNELRGERTGIRYRMSDRVRVQVSRVDLDSRKIDFRLVRDTPVKPPSGRIAPGAPEHAASTASAGPRARPFSGDDETPGTRRRGGSKRGSAALATTKDSGAARKHGTAPKPASPGRAARKKR
jgi:ribonuclease R